MLARELGMTVADLLSRISSREMTEWMAFYQLEPFGTNAEMVGHAITASTVYNVNRGRKNKAAKPADFMPDFESQVRPKTIDDMLAKVQAMNAMYGGVDERTNDS